MKHYSLIDKVYRMDNLRAAYRAVRANNGAPGIDGETVDAFGENLEARLAEIYQELRSGSYEPSPVRRVEIPKPDGSKRPLGIPTVGDRVVQQALLNVVQPIFGPEFHPSSYGYRPGRSCHQAVAKAERFINRYGLKYVVDMDLSKCFDRLDHDLIIEPVNRKVSDGSVLKLIRKFLEAGVMKDGAWEERTIGSPQGGVISPLLANIYLDYFDQKMKSKDIRIVRYADDILIFARTRRQAEKFLEIACEVLEGELKLVVNRDKTHITSVYKGVPYLGFVIYPKKLAKFKDAVRKLTPRNHGMSVEQMVKRLNRFLIANCKTIVASLMGWIRRRLRMKQMGEWKSWRGLHKALRRRGYSGEFLKISMRRWRNSASPLVNMALPQAWFSEIGLIDLTKYEVGVLHLLSD
jgi:RNA-directed DNA polymerase